MNDLPHMIHYRSNSRKPSDQTVAWAQPCSLEFRHLFSLPADGFTAYPANSAPGQQSVCRYIDSAPGQHQCADI